MLIHTLKVTTWRRSTLVLGLLQGPQQLLNLVGEVRLLDQVFSRLVARNALKTKAAIRTLLTSASFADNRTPRIVGNVLICTGGAVMLEVRLYVVNSINAVPAHQLHPILDICPRLLGR